jgi:hypothetical protein
LITDNQSSQFTNNLHHSTFHLSSILTWNSIMTIWITTAASLLLILQVVSGQNTYPVGGNFSNCDLADYYSLFGSTSIDDVARNSMRELIRTTHRNVLPYTSDEPDVWDALIAVDGYDDASGIRLIKRIYSGVNVTVPAFPYDQGSCQYWNREHL